VIDDNTREPSRELSGGQWQRITAGRGFYRDADLLIMDEPSSALDPRAEDALFQSIRSRQGDRTTILIAHRLANVIHADRIYVMHDGRLEEQGTHADWSPPKADTRACSPYKPPATTPRRTPHEPHARRRTAECLHAAVVHVTASCCVHVSVLSLESG